MGLHGKWFGIRVQTVSLIYQQVVTPLTHRHAGQVSPALGNHLPRRQLKQLV